LSTHLHLGLPSDLFPSGFPTNTIFIQQIKFTRKHFFRLFVFFVTLVYHFFRLFFFSVVFAFLCYFWTFLLPGFSFVLVFGKYILFTRISLVWSTLVT
jgi:hypothetical protein